MSKKNLNKGLAAVFGQPDAAAPAAEQKTVQPTEQDKTPIAAPAKASAGKGKTKQPPAAKAAPAVAAPTPAPAPRAGKTVAGAKKKVVKVPGAAPEGKTKVTYYVDSKVVKAFKHLSVDLGRRDSALAEEAMGEIVRKYERKRA